MENCSSPPIFRREETISRPDVYEDGLFFEIHVGDIYQERYIVMKKLGFGMSSTVWLVHDVFKDRYFAMKVLSTECYGNGVKFFELEILNHLRENESDHPGHLYGSKLVDSFTEETLIGTTLFFIFEVMAETLHSFIQFRRIHPEKIIKRFAKQLLLALDHAHKSGVIHTDIKSDNIMIELPDQNIIKDQVLDPVDPWASESMGDTELDFLYWPNDSHELIRREHGIRYDFMKTIMSIQHTSGGMEAYYLDDEACEEELLKLNAVFCDWGLASWTHKHLYEDISSPAMASPEVLLGAPWDTKTDIWSLGIAIFEMLSGRDAFDCETNEKQYRYFTEEERELLELEYQEKLREQWEREQSVPQNGKKMPDFRECENRYDVGVHLNEIATMIEPFSESLLDQVNQDKEQNWNLKSIFNNDGTVWGYEDHNRQPLEDHFPHMREGEDKENFLNFLWRMLRVDPEDRSSAEELLQEPWLQNVVLDDEDITPPTPPPTPPPSHDHEQPDMEPIDAYDDIADSMDFDTPTFYTEATTPIPEPIVENFARADIDWTNCDDKIVDRTDGDISTACAETPTPASPPVVDNVAQTDIDILIAAEKITPVTTTCTPSPVKDRSPSKDKGKNNAGKKKNKKRKRGGKL